MVKTKIIATLGPSSSSLAVLRKMMIEGMDVVRLNFSHGSHREHLKRISLMHVLNKRYKRKVKILQDLEGYRIRVGALNRPLALEKKQVLALSNIDKGLRGNVVPFDYSGDIKDIKKGLELFIDDGNIALTVLGYHRGCVLAEVTIPGVLKSHKGMNIPGLNLKFKGMTKKDLFDLDFGIKNRVDYVAQSFVRGEFDILQLREILNTGLPACKIIAKIENRQGIDNIDSIIKASDGIMIARGDMGVSIPIYEVPIVQKEIIKKCNNAGKLVITATQMLESMTEHLRPTRAEVTDVSNAVLDGTDMVMLSAETAVGKYPIESIAMMNDIIKYTNTYIKRNKIRV